MTNNGTSERFVIADPVHLTLDFGCDPRVTDVIKRVIRSAPFQRLRYISQLGLASYIFPGAVHTRFAHGIGAAYLAQTVVRHLKDTEETDARRVELENNEPLIVLAALLHDVGHGPFSHCFERAMKGIDSERPSHEKWTSAIIRRKLSQEIDGSSVDCERLAGIFEAKVSSPAYIKQIVASQLDVDRMDYLLRDSLFTGVSFGRVDIHYLIRSLALINHGQTTTLGLSEKGARSYEPFAMARHFMNRTVYYHRKVKVMEFMMEKCLALAVADLNARAHLPPYLCRFTAGPIQQDSLLRDAIDDYLGMTEDVVMSLVRSLARSASSSAAGDMARRILERDLLPNWVVEHGPDILKNELSQFAGAFEIVETKSTVYTSGSKAPVFVMRANGLPEEITSGSFGVSVHSDRPETKWLLIVTDTSRRDDIKERATRSGCIRPARDKLKGNLKKSSPPSDAMPKVRPGDTGAPVAPANTVAGK
jgi:HD superfamily phosphohydrolase